MRPAKPSVTGGSDAPGAVGAIAEGAESAPARGAVVRQAKGASAASFVSNIGRVVIDIFTLL
jgi:hypothetical protein